MDSTGHVTGCGPAAVVDARPIRARLLAVSGDPFTFRLVLRDADGDPVDVSLWDWAGAVTTGQITIDFEWRADDTGVWLGLRGDETVRLPVGRDWPFDVSCRQPAAGEGVTVLSGEMSTSRRVTAPLRDDPDARPGREDDLVPA